ncbi:MAG: DMT family transporter [Acidimicrobiales bacterium]
MMYAFLLGAIAAEVTGTLATRQSDGFTRLVPSLIAIAGVVGAYYLFSLTLKNGMNIGAAYATWAALGVAAVAMIGATFLGDTLTRIQVLGLVFVVGGVLTLELGSAS